MSKRLVTLIAALLIGFSSAGCHTLYAGTQSQTKISFRQGSANVDKAFRRNEQHIRELGKFLQELKNNPEQEIDSIVISSGSSPEGDHQYNLFLSRKRAENIAAIIKELARENDLGDVKIVTQANGVDWEGLERLIRNGREFRYMYKVLDVIANTPELDTLANGEVRELRKMRLAAIDDGKPYLYIYDRYFEFLRQAALVTCVVRARAREDLVEIPHSASSASLSAMAVPMYSAPSEVDASPRIQKPEWIRRPLFSVKTNLLLDFAPYIPGYGWCPMPNIGIEYFPNSGKGHKWTASASLDIPWWKDAGSHRYFQVRNYQLEARRYFKPQTHFTGWYLSLYAQAGLYGIGMNDRKGWQGEAVGAGLGAGYVLGISRSKHWRLDFNIQLGFLYTGYDPYVYGDPVNGETNGLYYYDWKGNADDFAARQYRWQWFGPTKVGIILSYDLIKRRKEVKR